MRFLLAFALMGSSVAFPAKASDRSDAETALRRGISAVRAGDYKRARVELLNASKADASWALPYGVQAAALLGQGDGVAAQTAVERAREAGMAPQRLNHLMAHALLLQGQPKRALELAEPGLVAPQFRGYAARVRALAFSQTEDYRAAGVAFDEAVALRPRSSELWTEIGRFRFAMGNVTGATDAAARAVALRGSNVDALILMGDLVRGNYGLMAAIPWFERAVAAEPNNLFALRELAATQGDAGQTNAMLQTTRAMLVISPNNADAFFLQAVLAARAKKYDVARSILYRTKGVLDEVPAVMLLNAALEMQAGNAESAVAILEDIVTDQPGNIKAQRLLGAALWRAGDSNATIATLRRVANREDADSYVLSVIGRAYEAQGDRSAAAAYLNRAAQPVKGESRPFEMTGDLLRLARASVGPSDNADTAVPYINKLVLDGRTGEALELAMRLRRQNPGAPGAHMLVGDALMAQNRTKEAVVAYRTAASIRFNEPVAMRFIEALIRSGDDAAALHVLDLYLSQNPRSVPGLLLAADHFMATADWDNAVKVLEGLRFRLGNRDASVLAHLGWAWFNKGDAERAIENSAAAYGMTPGNAAVADAYGWILYASGRNREGGAALLEKAVATAPDHPGLRYHLGQALVGLGRKAEARAHLAIAANTPGFPDHARAAQLLSRL